MGFSKFLGNYDYKRESSWKDLVNKVTSTATHPFLKAYVRDKILVKNPSISLEKLSDKLDMSIDECLVLLSELRIMPDELKEEMRSMLHERFRYYRTALGGTFSIIHYGHACLLLTAFNVSRKVIIGLSSDVLVKKLGKHHVVPGYKKREDNLISFLKKQNLLDRADIVKIDDRFGPAGYDPDIDAIVVSPFTYNVAYEINRARIKAGLKPLDVVVCKIVLAYDHKPISTTRIMAGEISAEGKLLKSRFN